MVLLLLTVAVIPFLNYVPVYAAADWHMVPNSGLAGTTVWFVGSGLTPDLDCWTAPSNVTFAPQPFEHSGGVCMIDGMGTLSGHFDVLAGIANGAYIGTLQGKTATFTVGIVVTATSTVTVTVNDTVTNHTTITSTSVVPTTITTTITMTDYTPLDITVTHTATSMHIVNMTTTQTSLSLTITTVAITVQDPVTSYGIMVIIAIIAIAVAVWIYMNRGSGGL